VVLRRPAGIFSRANLPIIIRTRSTATMRRCAFLTLDDPSSYVIDDELAVAPLADLGWRVDFVSWRAEVVWSDYHAVVIRSTYDYIKAPDAFLAALEQIERSGTPLFNDAEIVRWNVRKTYLHDLAERGVPVVPTVFRDRLAPGELPGLLQSVRADQVVIKPVVGANADGAWRVDVRTAHEQSAGIEAYYADRALMAQPFVTAVPAEGEFSLFYFNGQHSHSILKTPAPADFRVQEEHGGRIQAVRADADLLDAGRAALDAIGGVPLYARADFVRANHGGGFWLMELELIEPSLYLRMDPGAPERFARAIHGRVKG
jgi:glutathione synthase/RimK-type ligase-like ATP-grasp enzyme